MHHAIIVTSSIDKCLDNAWRAALDIGCNPSMPMVSKVNGYATMIVPPDGSKLGWPDSVEGDQRRSQFIRWIEGQRYEDGSSPYEWCEVRYGSDDGFASVTRSKWSES